MGNRTDGLPPPRSRHYAAITNPPKLGHLLRDMRAHNGNVTIGMERVQRGPSHIQAGWFKVGPNLRRVRASHLPDSLR